MRHTWAVVVVVVCAADASAGDLKVVVQGLASAKGSVECVLWQAAEGFPRETEKAVVKVTARSLENGRATCAFTAVAAGTWAVSVIHDENDNGKMDTGVFGIPREAYGFSRDPRPFMRAPRFDEASFAVVEAPMSISLTVIRP